MSRILLFIGLQCLILSFLRCTILEFIFILLSSFIYYKSYKRFIFISLLITSVFVLYKNNDSISTPKSNIIEIVEVHTNYCVGKDDMNQEYIFYNVENTTIGDVIEVKGKYERIYSPTNRHTFSFKTYMEHKNIYYQMYVISYEVIEKSISIRGKVYNHIQKIENKEVKSKINQLFYKIREEESNENFIFMSGMHLSFLALLISKILFSYSIDSLLLCILYNALFPTSLFITRIFVLNFIDIIFIKGNKKEKLGFSIILLLYINPNFIYDIGFILSVLFRLTSCFNVSKLSNKIIQFLILFPVQLYYFHEFNFISFLLFHFIRNYSGVYLLLCLLSVFTPSFYPVLLFYSKIQWVINLIYDSNVLVIGFPSFFWFLLWIYMFYQILQNDNKRNYFYIILLVLIQIHCRFFIPFNEVTFIDVGQGDCILISEAFNGKNVLIDVAGHKKRNVPETIIYPYLKSRGIKRIDYVIVTHDDLDHSGGVKQLSEYIEIDNIIKVNQDIELNNIDLKNISLKNEYEDKNDNSILYFTVIDDIRYLFMGDAGIQKEYELMDAYNTLEADIIKIGHHGSKSSTSLSFITQIHPLISVISSGKNNYYNHPHQEVLENLHKVNSYIVNTQDSGSISIYSNRFIKFMITGGREFAIIDKVGDD